MLTIDASLLEKGTGYVHAIPYNSIPFDFLSGFDVIPVHGLFDCTDRNLLPMEDAGLDIGLLEDLSKMLGRPGD